MKKDRFTEKDTNQFYTPERDALYHRVWHPEGSLHWGVFEAENKPATITQEVFIAAMHTLDRMVIDALSLHAGQKVLEAGCGNGFTTAIVGQHARIDIHAVDINPDRIKKARRHLLCFPELVQRIHFKIASVEHLPFADNFFDSAFSQSVLYHVHHKEKALSEIGRVLKKGAILVFDDLFRPQKHISADGQKYVYDRLIFETPFDFSGYQKGLTDSGFEVIKAIDLSADLRKTYEFLAENAGQVPGDPAARELAHDFIMTARAVGRNEVGWGFFVARKK